MFVSSCLYYILFGYNILRDQSIVWCGSPLRRCLMTIIILNMCVGGSNATVSVGGHDILGMLFGK